MGRAPAAPKVKWGATSASQILRIGSNYLARPPVSCPGWPDAGAEELLDDDTLPIGERVCRAIHRRLLSKYFFCEHLAIIPSKITPRAPRVTEFDRNNAMVRTARQEWAPRRQQPAHCTARHRAPISSYPHPRCATTTMPTL